MILVLDASVAVDALAPTKLHEPALRAIEGQELSAPALIDVEVTSALARLDRAETMSTAEVDQAISDWRTLPVDRVPVEALVPDVWSLRRAVRVNDAFYLAAARALGAPLLTADARLARSGVRGVTISLLA